MRRNSPRSGQLSLFEGESAIRAIAVAAALVTALTASQAHGEDQPRNLLGSGTILGAGNILCGQWTRDRHNERHWRELEWVLGYATSASVYAHSHGDHLALVDAHSVSAWMDGHCANNPFDFLINATDTMLRQIANR